MRRVPWLANSFKNFTVGFLSPAFSGFQNKRGFPICTFVVLLYTYIILHLFNNAYQSYTIFNIHSDNESNVTYIIIIDIDKNLLEEPVGSHPSILHFTVNPH